MCVCPRARERRDDNGGAGVAGVVGVVGVVGIAGVAGDEGDAGEAGIEATCGVTPPAGGGERDTPGIGSGEDASGGADDGPCDPGDPCDSCGPCDPSGPGDWRPDLGELGGGVAGRVSPPRAYSCTSGLATTGSYGDAMYVGDRGEPAPGAGSRIRSLSPADAAAESPVPLRDMGADAAPAPCRCCSW